MAYKFELWFFSIGLLLQSIWTYAPVNQTHGGRLCGFSEEEEEEEKFICRKQQ